VTDKTRAEIGYKIQRAPLTPAGGVGTWADISTALANKTETTDATAGSAKFFYRVVAWNTAGQGVSNAVLTADPPGVPTAVVPSAGNARVGLSWTAPVSDGGAPVTGYAIQRSTDSGSTWATMTVNSGSSATTGIATGLSNGTSYVFRVAAVNAAGTGAWSAASASVIPDVLPLAPTIGTPTAGAAQATVRWTAPSANGGSGPSGYVIQYSTNNGVTWATSVADTGSTAVTAVVTGLTNNTAYVFRVAAINTKGAGAWSAASVAVTPKAAVTVPGIPLAPTLIAGGTGTRSIAVTWSAPANGGSVITGYAIQWTTNSGNTYTTVTSNTGSTAVTRNVTGLTAGATYRFRVAAINALGTGTYSPLSTGVAAR
jgi:titin